MRGLAPNLEPGVTAMRFLLLIGICFLASTTRAAEHTKDSLETIQKNLQDDKAVLLDVREKSEWEDGHLKDAKPLPLSQIKEGVKKEELEKLLPKGKIVYAHCAAGGRCLKAAEELQKLGYDVRPLKPGYQDLLKAGLAPAK